MKYVKKTASEYVAWRVSVDDGVPDWIVSESFENRTIVWVPGSDMYFVNEDCAVVIKPGDYVVKNLTTGEFSTYSEADLLEEFKPVK